MNARSRKFPPMMAGMKRWSSIALCLFFSACSSPKQSDEAKPQQTAAPSPKATPDVDRASANDTPLKLTPREISLSNGKHFTLRVPEEFDIKVAADGFKRIRFMAEDPDHQILVTDMFNLSDNTNGKLYRLGELDNESLRFAAPKVILSDLHNPNSIAFHTDPSGMTWLYVALTDRLVRYVYSGGDRTGLGDPETLAMFPDNGLSYKYGGWHLTRTVVIGSNNKVYVSVGSSCNVCEEREEIRATITEMDLDGRNPKIIARGLRNAVGLKFAEGNLYATNMGVDHLGDDRPEETMYKISNSTDYGWPWCYEFQGKVYFDDKLGPQSKDTDCSKTPLAFSSFGAHSSPLGLEYFDSTTSVPVLRNSFLVALHGSSKRTLGRGYRIARVRTGHAPEDFIDGFLDGNTLNGRPAGILRVGADAFLFTDDTAGVVYYVSKRIRGTVPGIRIPGTVPRIPYRLRSRSGSTAMISDFGTAAKAPCSIIR